MPTEEKQHKARLNPVARALRDSPICVCRFAFEVHCAREMFAGGPCGVLQGRVNGHQHMVAPIIQRRFKWVLLFLVVLGVCGCRSTSSQSQSRVPGMGWLSWRKKDPPASTLTATDPAAQYPAPSSVATPQAAASATTQGAPTASEYAGAPASFDRPWTQPAESGYPHTNQGTTYLKDSAGQDGSVGYATGPYPTGGAAPAAPATGLTGGVQPQQGPYEPSYPNAPTSEAEAAVPAESQAAAPAWPEDLTAPPAAPTTPVAEPAASAPYSAQPAGIPTVTVTSAATPSAPSIAPPMAAWRPGATGDYQAAPAHGSPTSRYPSTAAQPPVAGAQTR